MATRVWFGRAGIEPATLGSKSRPDSLQADARNGTCLHERAFQTATNCTEMRRYAASPYSPRAPRWACGIVNPAARGGLELAQGLMIPAHLEAMGPLGRVGVTEPVAPSSTIPTSFPPGLSASAYDPQEWLRPRSAPYSVHGQPMRGSYLAQAVLSKESRKERNKPAVSVTAR
jgi:hypothetical protein